MQTIHVAYAFDDNYTEISCVSMASLLHNTKNPVHFYVIESRLSDENKRILSSLKSRFSHGEWSFHTFDGLDEQIFEIGTKYLTIEAYLRLFIPEKFQNLDKMIYIDGDTVVEGDIAELWNIDLGDKYLGAIPSLTAYGKIKKRWLGISEEDHYYNSGILLLDLHKLRNFELVKKAVPIISKLHEVFQANELVWYCDQEVINHLLSSRCKSLQAKFNLQLIYNSKPDFDVATLEEWGKALAKPSILHFIGEQKPDKLTKTPMLNPMWERYYAYKVMTPFADIERDNERIKKYRQMEANMDKALILNPYSFIEFKGHTLFEKLAESLPDMLRGKKLALWGVGVDTGYIMAMLSTKDIYADIVVDGLEENHGKSVFHYAVHNHEKLRGRGEEYYVLICMRNEKPAATAMSVLSEFGYDEGSYAHVFKPLWDVINRDF